MGKITLMIDEKDIVADKGTTVLEAALQSDIYIPHLCYHPDLKPVGVCDYASLRLGEGWYLLV